MCAPPRIPQEVEHDRLTMTEIGIDLSEIDPSARILNHWNGVDCLFDGRWVRFDRRTSNNGKEYINHGG